MMINWHLFHQNQKNESSYVRIGPEIKKLVFFGLSRFFSPFSHQRGPKEGQILVLEKK